MRHARAPYYAVCAHVIQLQLRACSPARGRAARDVAAGAAPAVGGCHGHCGTKCWWQTRQRDTLLFTDQHPWELRRQQRATLHFSSCPIPPRPPHHHRRPVLQPPPYALPAAAIQLAEEAAKSPLAAFLRARTFGEAAATHVPAAVAASLSQQPLNQRSRRGNFHCA